MIRQQIPSRRSLCPDRLLVAPETECRIVLLPTGLGAQEASRGAGEQLGEAAPDGGSVGIVVSAEAGLDSGERLLGAGKLLGAACPAGLLLLRGVEEERAQGGRLPALERKRPGKLRPA
ncbi:MAG: hypothetical protein ACRDNE_10675 [Gaiellaceae bacterium]